MKTEVIGLDGKKKKEIELPKFFSSTIREDIVLKVLEAKRKIQPYSNSPLAGRQQNAQGKIVHRRHVWRSGYGYGISRVPRKILSRRGSRFVWQAAEIPNAVGGRRSHPPKNKENNAKINKKELRIALISCLTATTKIEELKKRYKTLEEDLKLPLIVESKLTGIKKTKEFFSAIKKILGEKIYSLAIKKKKIRSGRGKMRGRKYKSNAGALIVIGDNEKLKIKGVDIKPARQVSVIDFAAKNGIGRLTIYTEKAIEDLKKRLEGKNEDNKN